MSGGAWFRVLSGGRAGMVFTPTSDAFIAGRDESADLAFDRREDATVSSRHAQFQRDANGWTVRDLGSRNGTMVNGTAISLQTPLRPGDRVTFGAGGPEVELIAGAPVAESATARVRTAVKTERKRAALIACAVIVVVAGASAMMIYSTRRSRNDWTLERTALERRIDSLISAGRATSTSTAARVSGLSSALAGSDSELQRLRAQLDATRRDGDAGELRRGLIAATAALQRQQLAASLDFASIQRRARGAVAMIWVEFGDGRRVSGTAFAVRPSGALLTNRHLMVGADGVSRPSRIAVRFSDSEQAFPAHLVSVSAEWELALVQVDNVAGDVPSVGALDARAEDVSPGTPVAIIGYPLGGEPVSGPLVAREVARPIVSAGIIRRSTPTMLEVQGIGAAGASGSPILDGAGDVVAVLYGGTTENGVQMLFGVPARTAMEFLSSPH